MIQFRIAPHAVEDYNVVEVWRDGTFVATVYGDDAGTGLRIISKYLSPHFVQVEPMMLDVPLGAEPVV